MMTTCTICGEEYDFKECPFCLARKLDFEPAPSSGGVRVQRMVGWLCVPTEPEPCWIPLGMNEEDFELLEATLKLWRSRIIVQPEKPANGKLRGGEPESMP